MESLAEETGIPPTIRHCIACSLLTDKLTCSIVFLEKLIVTQLPSELFSFCGIRELIIVVTKAILYALARAA
jgi:hypothetical protein